jgi:hypothetical protein
MVAIRSTARLGAAAHINVDQFKVVLLSPE